jgi:predicted  nucleic acid-binding Zn-ribbon protein
MNAELEHLIVLQSQDLELKRLRAELAEAPKKVAAAEAAQKNAAAALAAAKAALLKEEVLRRSQQSDVKDRQAKIARLRKQMETASSAAQITALEHEVAFAESAIAKFEDEELASMERSENFDASQTRGAAALESATGSLSTTRTQMVALVKRNDASVLGIEAERKTLRATLAGSDAGEALLATYDRIAKGKGAGVSEALDHKCSVCQMMVRPQRWNDMTGREHDDEIFHCESCGRILFYDPRRNSPGVAPGIDRLKAAGQP